MANRDVIFGLSLLFIFAGVIIEQSSALTCIDEDGDPVDWYIVYKLPKYSAESGYLYNGTGYLYLDVNTPNFTLSKNNVNSSSSAFYRTLKPIYSNYANSNSQSSEHSESPFAHGFYNDQWPDNTWTSYRGHTKGAWAFDSLGGFFLTHSVPKFPNFLEGGYSYPSSGCYYGQSMMCISLNASQFDKLGTHFLYTYPWNYNVSIPSQFRGFVPNLVSSTIDEKHVTKKPYTSTETIYSSDGVEFTLFSKWKAADEDMVSEMMAPKLKSDLFSQTWQNSGTNLPSDCQDKYWTFTVQEMYIDEYDVGFSTNRDHSKWAVGAPKGFEYPSDWVCHGGMNRQASQEGRSGGYTCFRDKSVNHQYVDLTIDLLDCTFERREKNKTKDKGSKH
ncbi:plancitoxin-1-like [Convolutriloba macropyga]|uniref:plancitoxin-1-like n=1 Tax=Convolutriloba macropyga TaxID=536237 RepID=UPI003F51F9F0